MGALLTVAAPAQAAREIPIGLYNVNDAQGHHSAKETRLYAIRFVLDKPTTIYRFFSGFNIEGVYTNGSGGTAPEEVRTKCQDKRTEAACPGKEFNSQFQAPPASLPVG